jgi:hypothetical protein
MPRMSETESFEIIEKGLRACGMTIDEDAKRRIEHLSEGLPHYAHLLALHSAQAAASEGRLNIQTEDTQKAIEKALQQAQESVARSCPSTDRHCPQLPIPLQESAHAAVRHYDWLEIRSDY